MINRRKVGMTSSHHGPYGLGYTRATMVGTEGCEAAMWSQSQKTDRSPDCSLQLDCMKSESLVIANQNVGRWRRIYRDSKVLEIVIRNWK